MRSIELGLKFTLLIFILYPASWLLRLIVLGLSIIVGMVSNLFRIAVVIGFGAWRGTEFAMETGHETVGPLVGLFFLLGYLILVVLYFGKRGPPKTQACCERRMVRYAPRLAGCTVAALGVAALLSLAVGSPHAPRPPARSIEQLMEMEAIGEWIRVPALFCRSAVCVWPSSTAPGGVRHARCECGAPWDRVGFYSHLENEEAGAEVFRAIYRHRRTGTGVSLVVVQGGRPGQTLCWPRWHLRSMGATVGPVRRERIFVAGSSVPVSRFKFIKRGSDAGPSSHAAAQWYVSGSRVHSHRLRLASFFEPFDPEQWVGMLYTEGDAVSEKEMLDLLRQLIM